MYIAVVCILQIVEFALLAMAIHVKVILTSSNGERLGEIFFGLEDGSDVERVIRNLLINPPVSTTHSVYDPVQHVYEAEDVYPIPPTAAEETPLTPTEEKDIIFPIDAVKIPTVKDLSPIDAEMFPTEENIPASEIPTEENIPPIEIVEKKKIKLNW